MSIDEIRKMHKGKRKEIEKRLLHFKKIGQGSNRELFAELCFCLLTPQTKARVADAAMGKLLLEGELFESDAAGISRRLREAGVRFHKKKGEYVAIARQELCANGFEALRALLPRSESGQRAARDFLALKIKGIGKKEASHFLRNVGHGSTLAILDRHILKNLARANAIRAVPKTLTHKKYLEIEGRMEKFCKKAGVPMHHLDLLFWSKETGEIFK